MKTVYLIRHAKSSWEDMQLSDVERPLNKRGFRDAPFMAKVFQAKEKTPNLLISSPAVRAHTTAQYFADVYGIPHSNISIENKMYLGDEENTINIIQALDNDMDTVCIFGHNPNFTHLANIFSKNYIPNVPTCAIVKIEADINEWSAWNTDTASMTQFHYPKQYFF